MKNTSGDKADIIPAKETIPEQQKRVSNEIQQILDKEGMQLKIAQNITVVPK